MVLLYNNMEDIVKALNNFIETNYSVKGRFLHSKSYVADKNFKSLKKYFLNLYYVIDKKSIPIIEESVIVKEISDKTDKYLKIKFLEAVYDYVASDEFRDLVNGTIVI